NSKSQYSKYYTLLSNYELASGTDEKEFWNLGYLSMKVERYASAIRYLKKASEKQSSVDLSNLLISAYVNIGEFEEALKIVSRMPKKDKITECFAAESHLVLNGVRRAGDKFASLVSDIGGYSQACGDYLNKIVGDYYFERKEYAVALPFYEAYTKVYAHDGRIFNRMSQIYSASGETKSAKEYAEYAVSEVQKSIDNANATIAFYEQKNLKEDAAALQKRLKLIELK
ncbi:MAG: tetratricopeptide repeat protein, partial [Proteobacteria bacterium]|nr:tetratricopeptide repeat protein [Pseudomonadota bacterium]